MPEFASISLEVPVESDLFEGMKFREWQAQCTLSQFSWFLLVISPDPKSRTAVEDKRELMKL